jgi:6-phosphogluconolactonase
MARLFGRFVLSSAVVLCGLLGLANLVRSAVTTETVESDTVALYAADGAEFTHYDLVVSEAKLTRRDSVTLPGAVQYAWPHPSGRELYVIWSTGLGANASHGVTAYAIKPESGTLRLIGQPIPLKYRPIHTTVDRDGTHLLVVYNDPAAITVFDIEPDGSIGPEVKEPPDLDMGIYVHQVRVEPSNQTVVVVARGNYERRTDPGALKIFNYKAGALSNRLSIAPNGGANFNPRHMDFDKTGKFAFVTLEAQNKLQVYRIANDGTLSATPLFSKDTLADPSDVPIEHRQLTGTVHVHPSGRFVYTANRATGTVDYQGKQVWAGGEDSISVFALNPSTGEPTLIQHADTHGFVPRTFALDPSGRILVAANQNERLVRDGDNLKKVPESLAVFRVQADGKLDFVRTYEVEGTQPANLFWTGILAVPR